MARTASGRLRLSRSLLPRTSRFQASKRAPRKPCSSRLSAWIIVPMAPSSTRMRSAANWRSVAAAVDDDLLRMDLRALLCRLQRGVFAVFPARSHAEQVADRVHKIGAVHGVEMKISDIVLDQIEHLFRSDCGGDQLAGGGIVIEAIEAVSEPGRDRSAAARGERPCGLEVLHREDAGYDRDIDAACAHAVEIAKIEIVLEEKLRDCAGGAGVDLGLEHVDIGGNRGAVRMLFRIGRNRNFNIGNTFDT